MKELDVLLEAFFAEQSGSLAAGAWPQLEEFLVQEDNVLVDWISGRELPVNPEMLGLIQILTHAA